MSLKHGILGFLNYGEMTGYELNKTFEESLGFFWKAQKSQIYRELKNLEKDKFVIVEEIVQHDKPNKKEYSITEEGKKELFDWLLNQESSDNISFKNEFLMKIFFAANNTVSKNMERIISFKEECKAYKKAMIPVSNTIKHYEEVVEDKKNPIYWGIAAHFGNLYIDMCIKWCEDSIKILKELN